MATAAAEPAVSCPPWCVSHQVVSPSTDPRCHPDDTHAWHHGTPTTFETEADTTLNFDVEWCDFMRPDLDDVPPYVEVSGNDASGFVVHLQIRVGDLRRLAAHLVTLAETYEADR